MFCFYILLCYYYLIYLFIYTLIIRKLKYKIEVNILKISFPSLRTIFTVRPQSKGKLVYKFISIKSQYFIQGLTPLRVELTSERAI